MTASPVSPEAPVTGSRPMRILFALACAVLAAASIANFQREATEREAAEAFVRHFSLDLRRPDEIGAMKYEPAADLAASIAVNASLSDLAGGAAPKGAIDTAREAAAARELMVDAVAKRPGWAYHRFLLGRLAYLQAAGQSKEPGPASRESWAVPLRLAAEGAPTRHGPRSAGPICTTGKASHPPSARRV